MKSLADAVGGAKLGGKNKKDKPDKTKKDDAKKATVFLSISIYYLSWIRLRLHSTCVSFASG